MQFYTSADCRSDDTEIPKLVLLLFEKSGELIDTVGESFFCGSVGKSFFCGFDSNFIWLNSGSIEIVLDLLTSVQLINDLLDASTLGKNTLEALLCSVWLEKNRKNNIFEAQPEFWHRVSYISLYSTILAL